MEIGNEVKITGSPSRPEQKISRCIFVKSVSVVFGFLSSNPLKFLRYLYYYVKSANGKSAARKKRVPTSSHRFNHASIIAFDVAFKILVPESKRADQSF